MLLAILAIVNGKVTRTVISTPDAPPAIGPYSQGIVVSFSSGEGMVYVAGQIGMEPDGTLVGGGVTNETVQLMSNIGAILAAAGSSFEEVIECHCMLADLAEYSEFNAEYAKSFDEAPPVRAAYQVTALPKGARAEVKCTATWDKAAPKCHAGTPCQLYGCETSCPEGPDGPQECIDTITRRKCEP